MTARDTRNGPEIIVVNISFDGDETKKGQTCLKCGRVHAADETRAVGRFEPKGPTGYLAVLVPGATVRETRAEAKAETCAWFARA